MRIAAVDIGTNTVLLLIADIDKNGTIIPVLDLLRTPRLGEGSGITRKISKHSIERTLTFLSEYKDLILKYSVESIILCGTSALRDAKNKRDVIRTINNRLGFDVSVLNGNEEAFLMFRGALSGFPSLSSSASVIDIGGGSTEVAYYSKDKLKTVSFQLGAVKLTERFFKNNPPNYQQLSEAVHHIQTTFQKKELNDLPTRVLIGVAGTPTTIACLDQNLIDFTTDSIDGYRIKFERIEYWAKRLSTLSSAQINALSRATNGREDILTAATVILKEFMELYHFTEILVSTRGLRYGIVLREWDKRIQNKTAV